MGGLMYIQGDDAKPPCVSPYEQGLYLASLHAACGTLMALWERRASGRAGGRGVPCTRCWPTSIFCW